MEIKNGVRVRCATCGAEAIVMKTGEPPAELLCCDSPLIDRTAPK